MKKAPPKRCFEKTNCFLTSGIKGYAKAALALCIDYLFKDVMLHQVYCSIDESNTESQQLFVGQGFVLCGRKKEWIRSKDGFLDELEFQLIRKD